MLFSSLLAITSLIRLNDSTGGTPLSKKDDVEKDSSKKKQEVQKNKSAPSKEKN
jgi:hypothetical protein